MLTLAISEATCVTKMPVPYHGANSEAGILTLTMMVANPPASFLYYLQLHLIGIEWLHRLYYLGIYSLIHSC
jgi:hypothetical protein